jgi:hypothetical protein
MDSACGTHGEKRNACWEKLQERDDLEDIGVDGMITLK